LESISILSAQLPVLWFKSKILPILGRQLSFRAYSI
jgi:hypothetical protein